MPRPSRSRAWLFTWFSFPPNITDILATIRCEYIVYQEEKCPRTGRHHIQGYIYLRTACSRDAMRTKMPGAHFIKADGSAAKNKIYCTKLKTRVEYGHRGERGEMPTQGVRTDYKTAQADVLV